MTRLLLGLGPVISSRDVHVLDSNAAALGVSRLQLMENAGAAVARLAAQHTPPGGLVVVVAGTGGNGGDGFAAARHLAQLGYRVRVVTVKPPGEIRSPEARAMYEALRSMDLTVELQHQSCPQGLGAALNDADTVIDALLGVGLRGAPRSPYREAIEAVNSAGAVKVSVDVPSGLDADTGEAPGPVVKADYTVTFHKPKPGLLRRRDLAGEVVVENIGIPVEAELYAGPGDVAHRLPRRRWSTRKGRGGRVLVVGGSSQYYGAPVLAALAAQAGGVDLVYLASTPEVLAAAARHPTIIPVRLEGERLEPRHLETLRPFIDRADSIAVGMGMGTAGETGQALRQLLGYALEKGKRVVVDADGLKLLARSPMRLGGNAILTPHDREFEMLFGRPPGAPECVFGRAEEAARASAEAGGAVILLKGPIDVVADTGRARFNRTGAPVMSVGGTGDILAGLAAALAARGMEAFEAALAAAYVNGVAGAMAYRELGDQASALDVLHHIPRALASPEEHVGEWSYYRGIARRC